MRRAARGGEGDKLAIEAHDGDEQPGRQDAFRYQRCNSTPNRAEVGHERERERERARSQERAAELKERGSARR